MSSELALLARSAAGEIVRKVVEEGASLGQVRDRFFEMVRQDLDARLVARELTEDVDDDGPIASRKAPAA